MPSTKEDGFYPKELDLVRVTTQAGRDLDNAVVARTGNTLDGRTFVSVGSAKTGLYCGVVGDTEGRLLSGLHPLVCRTTDARSHPTHALTHTHVPNYLTDPSFPSDLPPTVAPPTSPTQPSSPATYLTGLILIPIPLPSPILAHTQPEAQPRRPVPPSPGPLVPWASLP